MVDEIKEMLDGEIKYEITNLSNLTLGTGEYTSAIENLSKLYRLRIEETKNEREFLESERAREIETKLKEEQLSEQVKAREIETQLKQEQLSEQVKDRYFRLGMDIAGLILPLMFYASWMKKGFKFEEKGTFTSTTFRGLFSRFRPSKN